MTTEIRWRRGTAAEHSTFTGALGEITVDTTNNRLVVHDGVTAGGFPAPSLLGAAVPITQGGTGAATASAARANLGSGATGDALFLAATAAAARTLLGASALGSTLFQLVDASAGRTALDVFAKAEVSIPNRLHNSNFQINQRTVSGTVTLTAGAYGHDRWKAGAGGCTYTFATTAGITIITITAGSLVQVVRGLDLLTGTYVVHWAGTAQGRIVGGSYASSTFTVSATAGTAVSIEFGIGTLSKPKMNEGTSLSVWAQPNPIDEQVYAAAYLHRQAGAGAYGLGQAISATAVLVDVRFPTEMVAVPTVLTSNNLTCALAAGGASTVSTTALSNQTRKGATVTCTTTGMTAGNASLLLGGASGVLLISCEP